jgi:hypothetical protein
MLLCRLWRDNPVVAMGLKLGAGASALLVLAATGTGALAAQKCAKPVEVTAIQAAAVQQELMVAALTCNDVTSFNAFQTSYSMELRSSDKDLQKMFRRLFGGRGESEYHAFKTRLANDSSMRSIHDNAGYCQEAQMVFAAALAQEKPTLANFVSGVTVHDEGPVDGCDVRVAQGLSGVKAAPSVVPTPNPLRVAALDPAPAAAASAAPDAAAPSPAPASPAAAPEAAASVAPAAAAPDAASAAAPVQTAAQAPDAKADQQQKKSGWLSGMFD